MCLLVDLSVLTQKQQCIIFIANGFSEYLKNAGFVMLQKLIYLLLCLCKKKK
jgi:CRISPR/Cas system-associated protein endoribonuclease Cas2